jgi:hypothetical protein
LPENAALAVIFAMIGVEAVAVAFTVLAHVFSHIDSKLISVFVSVFALSVCVPGAKFCLCK